MDRRKRQRDWSWRSNHIEVVDTVFGFSGAVNGGGAVGEGDTSGVKGSSETIFAKITNGDEGFLGNSRKYVCLAGCERHVQKKQKGGMGRSHGCTIGEDNKDYMSGGNKIGTGSCGSKEMATASRFGYGATRRVVGNKRSN